MDTRKTIKKPKAKANNLPSATQAAPIVTHSASSPMSFFSEKKIPQDIFERIAQFTFPSGEMGNAEFLKHAIHNEELRQRYQAKFDALYHEYCTKFFLHIVYGEQADAEAMIKTCPRLLLETGSVTDYSGRTIQGTALQMALGAEDVRYHLHEECMTEMIHKWLKQLPDGEKIIAEQTRQQFPAGWEQVEAARVKSDHEALKKVFTAIAASQASDDWECGRAIREFRAYLCFQNDGRGNIRTGKHFNHQLLVEAYKLYEHNYDKFGGSYHYKNTLAWRIVLGGIQRYIPAATAQMLCQGAYFIVIVGDNLKRSLRGHFSNSNFYPLDRDLDFRLGEDWAFDITSGPGLEVDRASPGNCLPEFLEEFCQRKMAVCHQLCSDERTEQRHCAVM